MKLKSLGIYRVFDTLSLSLSHKRRVQQDNLVVELETLLQFFTKSFFFFKLAYLIIIILFILSEKNILLYRGAPSQVLRLKLTRVGETLELL